MTLNIAILLDLNSFPPGNDTEIQHKYLKWVQEQILTIVSGKASNETTGEVDYSDILWSFKFFNSAKDVDYRNKKLEPFSIGTFEAFENASLTEFDRFRSCAETITEDAPDVLNKCSCLSQALKRITSDLTWKESVCKNAKPKNIIYSIFRVPRDEDELMQFIDTEVDYLSSPNSRHVLNALLPNAFLKSFHSKFNIQLNFIDTWILHKNENLEKDWNGTDYSKQVGKVLEYLNHGQVMQLQKAQPAPAGLPSYYNLLKNSLRSATAAVTSQQVSSTKLSEAQKVLQHNKHDPDPANNRSSKLKSRMNRGLNHTQDILNLSMNSSHRSSMKSSKGKRDRYGIHKENRHHYESILNDSFGTGVSGDSSASEDFGSQIFGKREERMLNKLIQAANERKPNRYQKLDNSFRSSHNSSNRKCMQPPQQKRLRRHSPQKSSIDGDSILSGPNSYSRAAQLLGLATERERRKCKAARKQEEEVRATLFQERSIILNEFGVNKNIMTTRLSLYLKSKNLGKTCEIELLLPAVQEFKDLCVKDKNMCMLATCQTIVPFLVEKLQNNQNRRRIVGKEAKEVVEDCLHVPIPDLRALILRVKNDEAELEIAFRECQLQILIRMEEYWLLPDDSCNSENLKDEIVDLLSLLAMYLKKPVDDFLANVIVQAYMETHSELLIRIYKGLNTDIPRNLLLQVTPSKSMRSRTSLQGSSIKSPLGSTESLFVPPNAQSQRLPKQVAQAKKGLQREDSFVSNKSSARYASHVYVNNPKKMVMVPARNVKKLATAPKSPKSPKQGRSSRVRRNLFDADGSKCKSSLSLARLSRSSSVHASSKSYGGSLASPRMRMMKSKRRLNLGDDEEEDEDERRNFSNLASPDMFSRSNDGDKDSNIICPATPSDKCYNSAKKRKRSSSSKSERVIQESPECKHAVHATKSPKALPTMSFYSTGSGTFRSRTWEKSGNKMMAAKIKRKIDHSSFMNSGLTLSDLEIIGGSASSPDSKCEPMRSPERITTDEEQPTSAKGSEEEQEPCCSKAINNVNNSSNKNNNRTPKNVEVVQANVNANIEALIRSGQSLALLKTTPKTAATPTKKISFNFDERLIKTPNRSSPATPKSILKTPNREGSSCKKSYTFGNDTSPKAGDPATTTHFQPVLPDMRESSPRVEELPKTNSGSVIDDNYSAALGEQTASVSSFSVSQDSSMVDENPTHSFSRNVLPQQEDATLGFEALPTYSHHEHQQLPPSEPQVYELQSVAPGALEPNFLNALYNFNGHPQHPFSMNSLQYTPSMPFEYDEQYANIAHLYMMPSLIPFPEHNNNNKNEDIRETQGHETNGNNNPPYHHQPNPQISPLPVPPQVPTCGND